MSSAEQRTGKLSVTEAVRTKRAVRAYRAEPVSEDLVRAILNASRAHLPLVDRLWLPS